MPEWRPNFTPEDYKVVPGARGDIANKRRRGKRADKLGMAEKPKKVAGGGSRTFMDSRDRRKTKPNADPRMPERSPV